MVSYNWNHLLKFSKFNTILIIHIDKVCDDIPTTCDEIQKYQKCLPKFSIIDFNISEVHFPQCFQNKQPKHMCDINETFKIFWFATYLKPFFRVWISFCSETLFDKEPVPFCVVTSKLKSQLKFFKGIVLSRQDIWIVWNFKDNLRVFAGFYDRLVRLGLPLKCNTNTNEKSESPTLLIKIKTSKAVLIQALNLV